MIFWILSECLLCPDLVVPDLGDVLGVYIKLVVNVLGVDTQLVVEVSGCFQCPHRHDKLCPFLLIGQSEL